MKQLTIVPLGLTAGDLTLGALKALQAAPWVCLRTARHEAADTLRDRGIAFEALDPIYVESDDFDALQDAVARHLSARLAEYGQVAYAVADPGSDATVSTLLTALPPEIRVQVLPGVGLVDRALAAALAELRGQELSPYTVCPATDLPKAHWAMARPLLVTEVASPLLAGEVKLALQEVYDPQTEVLLITGLGGGQKTLRLPLDELDRQAGLDHTSTLLVPPAPLAGRSRFDMADLVEVMRILRGPGGCPWDLEQTHESLRPYLIEEAYEAVDAIGQGDPDKIADELGDVLLQVVFHAQIGGQQGDFTLQDITTAICAKMMARHVHIFGGDSCATPREVEGVWEAVKQKERGQETVAESMRGVAGYLPALMRAAKVQKKARRVGFDFAGATQALTKVQEETGELAREIETNGDLSGEGGDLLFAAVNVLRLCGVDPEMALTAATDKFVGRFEAMEQLIRSEGKDPAGMSLEALDVYWERIKAQNRGQT